MYRYIYMHILLISWPDIPCHARIQFAHLALARILVLSWRPDIPCHGSLWVYRCYMYIHIYILTSWPDMPCRACIQFSSFALVCMLVLSWRPDILCHTSLWVYRYTCTYIYIHSYIMAWHTLSRQCTILPARPSAHARLILQVWHILSRLTFGL